MIKNYDYYRKGGIVELIVRDENGMKVDTFKWNQKDKKLEQAIVEILKAKYNIFSFPEVKQAGFFDS